MATGIFLDKEDVEEIRDDTIVNGFVDGDGYLVLVQYDGTNITAGYVQGSSTAEDYNSTANTLMKRNAFGRSQVEAPVDNSDAVNKITLDTDIASALAYAAALGTDAATANTIMRRDSSARAKVADPSAGGDIVNKTYADALGDTVANPSTIARRDASGKLTIVSGTSASHAVTKLQMETADSAALSSAQAYTDAKFADTGWITLPFNSGYNNFGASYPCAYRVVTQNGIKTLSLRGLVERAAGNMAASTAYTPVFTLPSGSRPAQSSFFPLGTSTGTTGGMVLINTDGVAEFRVHTVALTWASLDGIVFQIN